MRFFSFRAIRCYATISAVSVLCTLFVVSNLHKESAVEQTLQVREPNPPQPLPTTSSEAVVTERVRDWRRTNHVVLEYSPDVAQRLQRLAELQLPANHPDTVRLARDLLDPPPDNAHGIKHSRYIMKTPQAEKVDEITQKMVSRCCLSSARLCHYAYLVTEQLSIPRCCILCPVQCYDR